MASVIIHYVEGSVLHAIEALGIVVGPTKKLTLPALARVVLLVREGFQSMATLQVRKPVELQVHNAVTCCYDASCKPCASEPFICLHNIVQRALDKQSFFGIDSHL